jgi:hypothetical protein
MPLKGLRPNRSEHDLKRRSTLDPAGLFKRTPRNNSHPEDAAAHLAAARIAVSEDGGRPHSRDVGGDDVPPSPPVQEATPNTKRFSLMRFRHASDSQLSVKAKEHAGAIEEETPPVPAMPVASTCPGP